MIGRFTLVAAIVIAVFAAFYHYRPKVEDIKGEALATVTEPQKSAEQKRGERLFNSNCASCHGVNAAGTDGRAPPLVHKIYEPSHHGDMAFVLAAKQGVRQHHWQFGDMPPQPDVSDDQIQSIIAYIRALQRANGIK